MALFLIGAGAVVLEVHRALNGGPKDVHQLRQREKELRKQLQDIQRELEQTRTERELTVREAVQLAAVNQQLATNNEELGRTASSLARENEELQQRERELLEKQQALELCAESLKEENMQLLRQFDRLKIKYELESEGFQEQLAELKQQVAGTLGRFTAGEISAQQLIAFLSDMGVELRTGSAEGMECLPDELNSARSREERLKLLDRVELAVDDNWVANMRLVTAEPNVAARLMAGSQRGSASAALPATSAAAQLTYTAPAKLDTPKARTDAQRPSFKVPPLQLKTSEGAAGAGTVSARAAASGASSSAASVGLQDENVNATQQLGQIQPAEGMALHAGLGAGKGLGTAKAAGVGKAQQQGGSNFLTFVPAKKPATRKQATVAASPPRPSLQLDLPLGGGHGHSAALARRPFDALDDDMALGSGRAVLRM